MAGLLGLGGIGGSFGAQPPAGLLGKYFDPQQMRNQQIKQGLLGAGIGMLQGGVGSTGQVLGQALAGGLQGANNAGINYKADAMGYQQLEAQMNEQARKRKMEARDDTEYQYKLDQRDNVMEWLGSLSPEDQKMAEAYPEAYAQQYLQSKFSTTAPKAPSMETLYDEKSGQPYKAQWDEHSNSWKRVGGNKADENGITITNPDGTTTQIGGSGVKVTEGMRRAKGFKASMKSSIESLQSNFEALTDPRNYLGDATRAIGGRAMMTPEGQMAADNFDEVVADALYIASGATLTAPEVERKKAAIIPTPNDDKKTIEAKRRRLADLVAAVDVMAGDAPSVNAVDLYNKYGLTPKGQ